MDHEDRQLREGEEDEKQRNYWTEQVTWVLPLILESVDIPAVEKQNGQDPNNSNLGGEEFEEHPAHILVCLLVEHVRVEDDQVIFRYTNCGVHVSKVLLNIISGHVHELNLKKCRDSDSTSKSYREHNGVQTFVTLSFHLTQKYIVEGAHLSEMSSPYKDDEEEGGEGGDSGLYGVDIEQDVREDGGGEDRLKKYQ